MPVALKGSIDGSGQFRKKVLTNLIDLFLLLIRIVVSSTIFMQICMLITTKIIQPLVALFQFPAYNQNVFGRLSEHDICDLLREGSFSHGFAPGI
ncbi:hypothetical protein [Dehalobacter restrictus]|uniref:hypothetical protein n=1 Tax=Dehalobacter restrictus TaxID=55583 RepID=UPI0011870A8E|nr:hypothetical protein [Dehalobacter restrictus]